MQQEEHQISKLVMKLHVPKQEGAHEWLNTAASVTKNSVLKSINKVLDEFDTHGKIIRIPRIEIDLTETEMATIDQDTALLIEEKLRAELSRILQQENLQQVLAERNISTSEEGVTIIDRNMGEAEQVFFYLENGYLPWWAKNTPGLVNQVIQRLWEERSEPQFVKTFQRRLLVLLKKEPVRKRVAMQLQLSTLEKLVQLLLNDPLLAKLVQALRETCVPPRNLYVHIFEYCAQPIEPASWLAQLIHDPAIKIQVGNMLALLQDDEKTFRIAVNAIVRARRITTRGESEKNSRAVKDDLALSAEEKEETEIRQWLEPFRKKYTWVKELLQEHVRLKKTERVSPGLNKGEKYFQPEIVDAIDLHQAGLVIVHAYLVPFFNALGLLEGNGFKDETAQHYAVQVLHYLASGTTEMPEEHQLVLHKLLCGLEPVDVLQTGFELSERHKEQCEELLTSVIEHWSALKKTSPAALRHTFFQRMGRLSKEKNGWSLKIERQTVDILIDKLPWGMGVIKMPWYNEFIFVEW